MRGHLCQLGVVLLTASVLIGCKTTNTVKERQPSDPLCYSKKPLEGNPRAAAAAEMVRVDPQPPPIPARLGSSVVQETQLGAPQPVPPGLD